MAAVRAGQNRTAAAPALMLSALGLIFRRLIAGRVLAGGDLHLYFYPYWMEVARSLQAGRLPLWNPYLFAGAPLLANSQVGVFYPLNWPFWLFFRAASEPIARAIHWSVLLHIALAAINLYAVLRQRRLGRWSAAFAGMVYAGSGFIGVHTEHLNQLQALAWLPLLFMPDYEWHGPATLRRFAERLSLPHPASIAATAMILLAGHTQMAFIAAAGLGVWTLVRWTASGTGPSRGFMATWAASLPARLLGLAPYMIAGMIAAVQLVPTFELARYSGRSGGLDWREAVSFSLAPWDIPQALLPPYIVSPLLPEGVGTVGILALMAAAVGAWRVVATRSLKATGSREGWPWLVMSFMGLMGALGGYSPLYLLAVRLRIPGFVHFRAPARFLALFVLGGVVLAAIALEWLIGLVRDHPAGLRRSILATVAIAIPLGVAAELVVSAEHLPHAAATIVRAYTDLRPAAADLAAHAVASATDRPIGAGDSGAIPGRFLSISQALFEVGDKAEIEIAYGDALSADALWAYLVSSKLREIVAPNLSMVTQVQAVDGYDGGLLPLKHFIAFTRLLLPEGTVDGRLRENIVAIPDQRWLDLLGVAYLVTDKTTDAWLDGILYDRQFQPLMGGDQALDVAWLPQSFVADSLGLLYEGSGAVRIELADGRALDIGLPTSVSPAESYRVTWEKPTIVTRILLRAAGHRLDLQAASLLNSADGAFYPIVLSDAFRLVHSGDVKIYERVTPGIEIHRAFLVHQACSVDPEGALALMRDPAFDPHRIALLVEEEAPARGECVLEAPPPGSGEWVRASQVREDQVVIDVQASSPGYLIVADAWYPGWLATVQRLDAPAQVKQEDVLQADLLFRAVPIEAGTYRVTLSYVSRGLGVGAIIGVAGVIGLGLYAELWRRRVRA